MMSSRFQPPFERSVCVWEAQLMMQCSNKGIEVWEMNREDYVRGDIVAMDDTLGAVAGFATWLELESRSSDPVAMLVQIEDFLPQGAAPLRVMYPTVGIHPLLDEEFVELEAFSLLEMTEEDRRAFRENDTSSSWVEFRRLAEQNGWRLVETRLQSGGSGFSLRCRLDRSAISPEVSMQEVRTRGFSVIYERIAGFVSQVAEIDARIYEHIMRPQRSSGCYIATAVYGSYDCPEVRVLRRWRDDVLLRKPGGKRFVRTYYALSPYLVNILGSTRIFTSAVKPCLNLLVRRLQRSGVAATTYEDKPDPLV